MRNKIALISAIIFFAYDAFCQESRRMGDGPYFDFCYSPSETCLFSAGLNGVFAWDLFSGKQLIQFGTVKSTCYISVDIAPDSSFLAASGTDSTIYLWNLQTLLLEKTLKLGAMVHVLKFHGEKEILAGTENGELLKLIIPDLLLANRKRIFKGEITSLIYDEGYIVLAGEDRLIKVLTPDKWVTTDSLSNHHDWIRALIKDNSISDAYSCGDDGKVFRYHLQNGRLSNSHKVFNSLFPHWVISLDTKANATFAIANVNGRINILTDYSELVFHCNEPIYKIRFFPKTDFLTIVAATSHGIRIISANEITGGN